MAFFSTHKPTLLEPDDIVELCSYKPELLALSSIAPQPAPQAAAADNPLPPADNTIDASPTAAEQPPQEAIPEAANPAPLPAALPDENWKKILLNFMVQYQHASATERINLFTAEVVAAYVSLCRLTAPVTGTSMRQSRSSKNVWLAGVTLLFLAFSIFSLVLVNKYTHRPVAESSQILMCYAVYVYPILAGFLWGGLGSCVYVLKKVNDLQQARLFDDNQFTGVPARLTIGATLGWVVVNIFNLDAMDLEGLGLPAVAFLTGLSVKVVYGALESMVEFLSEKLNLRKPQNQPQQSLKDKLSQKVLELDPAKDSDVLKGIVQLQQLLAQKKPEL